MFSPIDFTNIIKKAWREYDPSRKVNYVVDISAMVSTNHVFRVKFDDGDFVIAKCSYFGKFSHFEEDHTIINVLGNTLEPPFENFLAKSYTKDNEVYTYQYKQNYYDAWVVFYNPIQIDQKLPRKLEEKHIRKLGQQLAKFHLACFNATPSLPHSSKSLEIDIKGLLELLKTEMGKFEHRMNLDKIKEQCNIFLTNINALGYQEFPSIPVFVDWNIGNFSVTENNDFFSRWDYDWFRMSSRMLDFYFFSRVSSSVGDRTIFSYLVDPLMEDRFLWFLEEYHKEYPLTRNEVLFLKEAYRFFILNYVIKYGSYFFHSMYATRLQHEAFEIYFPLLDEHFNADRILRTLKL